MRPYLLAAGLTLAAMSAHAQSARITNLMRRMTTAEKAAQLIMPWVSGGYTSWDDPAFVRIVRQVDSLKVGGIVISIGSPMEVAARLNHLQRRARVPLLVASDFEGGTAFRINGGTAFPTNMGVGAGGQESDAYAMGRIIAEEGRALGVHLTFSPVADINNNPANPIINTRSFGGDPAQVARMVAAQVRGAQSHGMPSTVKHFPGHGDTGTDTHIAYAVIPATWQRLDTLELVPFRAAVKAGVSAVMTAHVTLPAIDTVPNRPATMAREILTGILRDSLDFQGLIVSDALDMGAIVNTYGPGEAAVTALLAGNDILLMPTDAVAAVRSLVQAVHDGRVTRARLDRSVRRVLQFKERAGLFRRKLVNLDSVGYVVGRQSAMAAARAASARSLVLLRDSTGLVARFRAGSLRIGLVSFAESPASTLGPALASELRARGHLVSHRRLWPASGAASYDSARAMIDSAGVALFAVSVRAREGAGSVAMPVALAELISGARVPAMLVSFGSPYLISQVPEVPGYLLAWTGSVQAEQVVADALAGAPIAGRLPVAIPPLFRIGDGKTERRNDGR
jgi:beta-glucosidase-like glycosyl hydrolase